MDTKPAALEMSKNKLDHSYFKMFKMEVELNVFILNKKQKQNSHKIFFTTEKLGFLFAFYIVVSLILFVLFINSLYLYTYGNSNLWLCNYIFSLLFNFNSFKLKAFEISMVYKQSFSIYIYKTYRLSYFCPLSSTRRWWNWTEEFSL